VIVLGRFRHESPSQGDFWVFRPTCRVERRRKEQIAIP
jgi:hypothetical protein